MASFNPLLKRTNIARKRPNPSLMSFGELNINYDPQSGGVFYKDGDGNVRKLGPAEIGATEPNTSPVGSSGLSVGELWYDTSDSLLKLWSGTEWLSVSGSGAGRNPATMMRWTGNSTNTNISSRDVYTIMSTSNRSISTQTHEFAINSNYTGVNYTGGSTRQFIVTGRGLFDGGNNDEYSFGIGVASNGTPNLPSDVVTESTYITTAERDPVRFDFECLVSLTPNSLVFPIVANTSDTSNVQVINFGMSITTV